MRAREHQIALSAWDTDYFDLHSNADVFNINKDNGDDAKAKPLLWCSCFKNADSAARRKGVSFFELGVLSKGNSYHSYHDAKQS